MNFSKFILVFILSGNCCFSQQIFRVTSNGLRTHRIFEAFPGDVLDYKLKGERKFRQNKIFALSDSVIIFGNDAFIKFSELKRIRVRKNNRLIKAFSALFIRAGFVFITVDIINNQLLNRQKVVNESALLISAGLVTTGLIIKRLGIKKIRINKNKTLKIIDIDYQHLNK